MSLKEFEDRILNDLLPEFCNDPARRYGTTGFKPDFGAVDDADAQGFLQGLDAGLVKLVGRMYRAPRSHAGEQFFWEHGRDTKPRAITLWIEPIITVATLSRFHFELGWPKELLGTQSVDDAFDAMAYVSSDTTSEYVACEVKKTTKELDFLTRTMLKLSTLPPTANVVNKEKNAYRKIKALRARRAPFFWAVGPGGGSVAFKLTYLDGGPIIFDEVAVRNLGYPLSPTASTTI